MNKLSLESSPYLLQHKDNPVHWFAWGEEAWTKAKQENKLVLVSIGYSSCHWCHVMEHEVFEDFECAEYMNMHFVCMKVDREERPDIDSIYMDAVHLMASKGGWPLNVFTLPDGRPVYGGTYFPKQHWLRMLENLHDLFQNDFQKVVEYAARLHSGLTQLSIVADNADEFPFDPDFLDNAMEHWSKFWDMEKGGARKAPKFPMPNNIELLLHYGSVRNDQLALSHAFNTLRKMALGGIFDQCGGGFSRYSVDDIWKVPHFEKMLYDNAQLISVYAHAHRMQPDPLFVETIEKTIGWLNREMKSADGLYYAALDADSEGEEGKFYTWTKQEIEDIFGDGANLVKKYYCIDAEALWEHSRNILLRKVTDEEFAGHENISIQKLKSQIADANEKLLQSRSDRIRPGLDIKCITSWNAMLVSGFCDCYRATFNEEYRTLAKQTFDVLHLKAIRNDETIWHQITDGKPAVEGFLDDYAFMASAALDLYELTFDERYIQISENVMRSAIQNFLNSENSLFFFTTKNNEWLTRKQEVQDNVIPASNSVMANALFRLSQYMQFKEYEEMSQKMLRNILPQIDVASGYSNWLKLFAKLSLPHYELVICGTDILEELHFFHQLYLPQAIIAASTTKSELPLLKDRFRSDPTIYVCSGRTCFSPAKNVEEAMKIIYENKIFG